MRASEIERTRERGRMGSRKKRGWERGKKKSRLPDALQNTKTNTLALKVALASISLPPICLIFLGLSFSPCLLLVLRVPLIPIPFLIPLLTDNLLPFCDWSSILWLWMPHSLRSLLEMATWWEFVCDVGTRSLQDYTCIIFDILNKQSIIF